MLLVAELDLELRAGLEVGAVRDGEVVVADHELAHVRHVDRLVDDDLFLLLNGHHEPVPFCLPPEKENNTWTVVVDTATGEVNGGERTIIAGETFEMPARSLLLLRR